MKRTAEDRALAKLRLEMLRLEREKVSYPAFRLREVSRAFFKKKAKHGNR